MLPSGGGRRGRNIRLLRQPAGLSNRICVHIKLTTDLVASETTDLVASETTDLVASETPEWLGVASRRSSKPLESTSLSVDDLQEPKAQVARAAHTLNAELLVERANRFQSGFPPIMPMKHRPS
jgi:hypothetical protein